MSTSDEKLLQIAAIIAAPTDIPTSPAAVVPAYDIPPLTLADNPIADAHTFNRDGSLWLIGTPMGGGTPGPMLQAFGYISPAKTPEVWAWAQANMTADGFAKFDAGWKANPYGVYNADPRDLIAKGVINLMSFSYMIQPFATFHQ